MANPYYTFVQTSFPGRIARAAEINSQLKLIEAGFDALGTIPGGADTQVQFNDGDNLGGDADFTFDKATDTLSVANIAVTAFTGATATLSGALQAASATVTGTSDLQGNVTMGGTLAVTGKATSAATVGGDGATTVVTKGYAESAFAGVSHTHAAADVTAGTFASARISESSVTQHQAAIDHDALTNYNVAEHRVINDASTAATDLWSAQKINDEIQQVVAGENPPAGSDGMVQFNNSGLAGGQAELSWDDTGYTLTVGTVTNAGAIDVVGGKVTSAATAGGDPSGTLTTKGYVEANFAGDSHTHAAADVVSGEFDEARIPGLPASKIDSGSFGVSRGGTGLNSLVASNYVRASTSSSFELRTPAQVLADIGGAASSHTHAAGDIVSGELAEARIPDLDASKVTTGTFGEARIPDLPASKITSGAFGEAQIPGLPASKIDSGSFGVSRGGTGRTSISTGFFLVGNNTAPMSSLSPSQVRVDIGAAPTSHTHSAADITSGVLSGDRIPGLPASKITSGVLSEFRIPDLPASKITSGVLSVTRGGTGMGTHTGNGFLQATSNGASLSSITREAAAEQLGALQNHIGVGTAASITVSTSGPSGGSNGDIWLQV